MPRRTRRSGVRFLEDEEERKLTFFKRRAGLFKAASDLSTLTGARIAVVLESETGKMYSFGTPSAEPILDAFLSGHAPTDPFTNEEEKVKITNLQNQLFQLEKEKAVEDKRKKESTAHAKEVQESSRVAKIIFSKEEELDVNELQELVCRLSHIKQEIRHQLPRLQHHGNHLNVGRIRDPTFLQSSWPYPMTSKIPVPQRRSPWSPFQPSFQLPQPSWFRPVLPQFPLSQPLESQLSYLSALDNKWVNPSQHFAWGMNRNSGHIGDNGGQATGGQGMLGFSGPLQGDGWAGVMSNMPSPGESSSGVDAGNSFWNVKFP